MPNSKRRAYAPEDRERVTKNVAHDVNSVELTQEERDEGDTQQVAKFYVPITKASEEERTVTGVALRPDIVDAQGDIMESSVIRAAAHNFLANYNKVTKLGYMHKDFEPKFELAESYLAPSELTINGTIVPEGSWIMVLKVLDDKIWKMVKAGKLNGLSIGGKAKVQKIVPPVATV